MVPSAIESSLTPLPSANLAPPFPARVISIRTVSGARLDSRPLSLQAGRHLPAIGIVGAPVKRPPALGRSLYCTCMSVSCDLEIATFGRRHVGFVAPWLPAFLSSAQQASGPQPSCQDRLITARIGVSEGEPMRRLAHFHVDSMYTTYCMYIGVQTAARGKDQSFWFGGRGPGHFKLGNKLAGPQGG